MAQPFMLCYGDRHDICPVKSSRSGYSVANIDDYFVALWHAFQEYKVKTKLGIKGRMLKEEKCTLILIAKMIIAAYVKGRYYMYTRITNSDGEVDMKKAQSPQVFEQLEQMILVVIKEEGLDEVKEILKAVHDKDTDKVAQLFGDLEIKLPDILTKLEQYGVVVKDDQDQPEQEQPAQEQPAQDKSEQDQPEAIPEAVPEAVPDAVPEEEVDEQDQPAGEPNDVVIQNLAKSACTIIQKNAAYSKSAEIPRFIAMWKYNRKSSVQKMKKQILVSLLLTYMRSSDMKVTVDKLQAYFNSDGAEDDLTNVMINVTDPNNWIASYKQSFAQMKENYVKMLDGTVDEVAVQAELDKLVDKGGFRYSVTLLSYPNQDDLRTALRKKANGKDVYNVADLYALREFLLSKQFPTGRLMGSAMEAFIVTGNPHCIKNAVTFYTDENLMDLAANMLFTTLQASNDPTQPNFMVGYDITEIALLIISQDGRNEHMGFPDLPVKGKIWKTEIELERLDTTLYNLIRDKDKPRARQAITDFNDSAKAIIQKPISELKTLVKDIEYQRLIPTDEYDDYYGYIALKYVLKRAALREMNEIMSILQDINLLHLTGYLGWIMVSDNTDSHSQDADVFVVTNKCKALYEKYILRLYEDDTVDDKYYYVPKNSSTQSGFNKKAIWEYLTKLNYKGQSLAGIINSHTCLHGIGGNIISLYLQTIQQIERLIGTGQVDPERDIPFYSNGSRWRPLSVFRKVNDRDTYLFMFKSGTGTQKNAFDKNMPTYDHVSTLGTLQYEVQQCDLSSGMRQWAGKLFYNLQDVSIANTDPITFLRSRVYKNPEVTVDLGTGSRDLLAFKNLPSEVALLARATDVFSRHRIEHFHIFTRYVVDFSNMLLEYANSGTLIYRSPDSIDAEPVVRINYEAPNKPYIYVDGYPDIGSASNKELEDYLYAHHLAHVYDEDDAQKYFEEHLGDQMNVNATVGRDYTVDSSTGALTRQSEMVYYMDLLAHNSQIYRHSVRNGQEAVYGVKTEYKRKIITDLLLGQLPGKESKAYKSFNQMTIVKSMMSKSILKLTDPNAITAYYMATHDGKIADTLRADVDTMFHYLNLGTNEISPNDKPEAMLTKMLKSQVYHNVICHLIFNGILPHMATEVRNRVHANVAGKFIACNTIIKQALTAYYDGDFVLVKSEAATAIKKLINATYDVLIALMSMHYNENMAMTYDYNFATLTMMEPLLKDVERYVNMENTVQALSTDVVEGSDSGIILKVYCDAHAQIFPSSDVTTINDPSVLMSELVDMTLKYSAMKSMTASLSALVFLFDKMEHASWIPPKSSLTMRIDNLSPELVRLVTLTREMTDIDNTPELRVAIGLQNSTDSEQDKINKLYRSMVELIMCGAINAQISVPLALVATALSMGAFELIHLYSDRNQLPAQPQAPPNEAPAQAPVEEAAAPNDSDVPPEGLTDEEVAIWYAAHNT